MLRSSKDLIGYTLSARDGKIGRCKDFLFEEETWVVRWMVADTGKWLPKRQVLISPISVGYPDWEAHAFDVRLSKEQIEKAPGLSHDAPVSAQHEAMLSRSLGYAPYWRGTLTWGMSDFPGTLQHGDTEVDSGSRSGPELRSMNEVCGYHILASDDEFGHVEDLIVDDQSWAVRYLVVDTRNWLPSPKVLVASEWVERVDWAERRVSVALDKEQIKNAPEYDAGQPVNRRYEERLYDYYGRPHYW